MERHLNRSRGFLLIAAVIMIVILSGVVVLIVDSFVRQSETQSNQLYSNQANAIAISALGIVKHDISVNSLTCGNITSNAKFTNASLFNGQFTVTGTETSASSTLSSNITAASTTIPLLSASSFATQGVITIGSEKISYLSKSGNSLTELTRGADGTTAASHSSGASASQNQCLINAIGAVPTIIAPKGKHNIQQILQFGSSSTFTINSYQPSMAAGGQMQIKNDSQIINPYITSSDSDYAGSNLISNSSVQISDDAETRNSNGVGGTTTSSDEGGLAADVIQNDSSVSKANLFGNIFSGTKVQVQAAAVSRTENNLNGVTNELIWVNGDVTLDSGNITIGSALQPVILIVDGKLDIKDTQNVNIYGLVFATGEITIKPLEGYTFNLYGFLAGEEQVTLENESIVTRDNSVLSTAAGLTQYFTSGTSTLNTSNIGFYNNYA